MGLETDPLSKSGIISKEIATKTHFALVSCVEIDVRLAIEFQF
jgi:hypothetical protein